MIRRARPTAPPPCGASDEYPDTVTSIPAPVPDADLVEAVVLLQRYSLELDEVAVRVFGEGPTGAVDLEILHAIARGERPSPSDLVERLGMPRSTLSRGLSRLRRLGLVERSVDDTDARRAVLAPTTAGAARSDRFESALADFLLDSAPVVKEVQLLLGRDPERDRRSQRRLSVREVADRIGAVGAAYQRDVRAAVAEYGVADAPDRHAVVYLALRESRPSLIAEHLHLTPAGTTSLLDRLEGLGIVERRTGAWPEDRRAVLVRLTPRGRRAAQAVLAVSRQHQEPLLDILGATLRVAPPHAPRSA